MHSEWVVDRERGLYIGVVEVCIGMGLCIRYTAVAREWGYAWGETQRWSNDGHAVGPHFCASAKQFPSVPGHRQGEGGIPSIA